MNPPRKGHRGHQSGERRSRRRGRAPRCRRLVEPGVWEVQARVERFVEPALLLLLADGPRHGYELAESLADLIQGDRPDMGNLYRLLRSLEDDDIVTSEWGTDGAGPARRTYELTDSGRALLDTWAAALSGTGSQISAFLDRWRSTTQGEEK